MLPVARTPSATLVGLTLVRVEYETLGAVSAPAAWPILSDAACCPVSRVKPSCSRDSGPACSLRAAWLSPCCSLNSPSVTVCSSVPGCGRPPGLPSSVSEGDTLWGIKIKYFMLYRQRVIARWRRSTLTLWLLTKPSRYVLGDVQLTALRAGSLTQSVDGVKPRSRGHKLTQLTNQSTRTWEEAPWLVRRGVSEASQANLVDSDGDLRQTIVLQGL